MGGGVLSKLFSKMLAGYGDDIGAKVASQYSDDAIRTLASSSADDIAAKQGNLIATHQLTSDKLAQVADLDGFVQPSMAVVDPSKGTNFLPGSDFGDIVMVANRSAIDPKRAAAKSVIGDRDIYSPRFPDTSYQLNKDALDDILRANPGNSKQYALSNMSLDDNAVYDNFITDLYHQTNPNASSMTTRELRESPEFIKFANDTQSKLRGEQMLEYRTPSGNTKTLPITAENANKIMNKSGAVGSEQGFSTPTKNIYHQNTNMINSLDDLYKNRYRLIDSETGGKTKSRMESEMMKVIDDLYYSDTPGFSSYDDVGDYVADAASGRRPFGPALDEIPDDVQNSIGRLQKAYQEVPVSYFEAKPRRVVAGNEFHSAYIPQDAPQEVVEQLNRLGVNNIQKYLDKGDLDLSLAKLAKEGKRGVSPYVLGLGGAIPTAGVLSQLFGGQDQQTPMV